MLVEDYTGAWDYGTLPANIRLGRDCYLERRESFERVRSTRDPALVLGDRVRVYTWTAFNLEPGGCMEVGDDSILVGPVFMCAERITIGRGVLLSYHVTVADCDFHPRDPARRIEDAIANAPDGDRERRPPLVAKPVVIEDEAQVGIGAIILKGVRIGRGARVMAGAVVARDVPPGGVAEGNPARLVDPAGAPP